MGGALVSSEACRLLGDKTGGQECLRSPGPLLWFSRHGMHGSESDDTGKRIRGRDEPVAGDFL